MRKSSLRDIRRPIHFYRVVNTQRAQDLCIRQLNRQNDQTSSQCVWEREKRFATLEEGKARCKTKEQKKRVWRRVLETKSDEVPIHIFTERRRRKRKVTEEDVGTGA